MKATERVTEQISKEAVTSQLGRLLLQQTACLNPLCLSHKLSNGF